MVSFSKEKNSSVASVTPTYVLHNNTAYSVCLKPYILEQGSCGVIPKSCKIMHKLDPGSTTEIIYWNVAGGITLTSNMEVTHGMSFTGCFMDSDESLHPCPWSICMTTDFVRHSFSLPTEKSSQYKFESCLLTMHEKDNITYLVLQPDCNPSIVLTSSLPEDLQVVEANSVGINSCPQCLPARLQAVYQPPSVAKLYPLVFDKEVSTDKEKRLVHLAENVRLKFRRNCGENDSFGWCESFSLVKGQHKVHIPDFGDISLFIEVKDLKFVIKLCPINESLEVVRDAVPFNVPTTVRVSVNLSYFLCSLLDDTGCKKEREVLRAVLKDFLCTYSVRDKNSKIDLTAYSLKIENMMRHHAGEFMVCFLPRSEHAPPSQLFHQDFPPLIKFVLHYSSSPDVIIHSIYFRGEPATVQLEDCLLKKIKSTATSFVLSDLFKSNGNTYSGDSMGSVPTTILEESIRDVHSITISSFMIEPISVYLSARITLKAFLSCNDTPLKFSRYELENVNSNWSEISRVVGARYVSGLFMHVGWVLGSLELIGSPVSFLQSVSRGFRDLVVLPYEGLTRSPGMFVLGIGHGTASFLRQLSSGALTSVTSLTQSISRNMEKLSMDEDHSAYQEELRQQRPPVHFTAAVASGFSSFGLSMMSAVAGLVEQPMQSVQHMDEDNGTATTLLKGVGKGLLGVVTKPVGGAMELISKTGQGILCGTGLGEKIVHSEIPDELVQFMGDSALQNMLISNASCLR